MKIIKTKLKDLVIIKKDTHIDNRGYFRELFLEKNFKNKFIFDVMSLSKKNVLRGLHLQTKKTQGKLITVIKGSLFDVAVDCRKKSKTFGKYFSIKLSENDNTSLYIPEGFAHGFLTMEANTEIAYKVSRYYSLEHDVSLLASSKELNLELPIPWETMHLSEKDQSGISILEI